ncbi:MAG: response regulator [Candidatus Brocadiaceae bacterium]|nr:response regulator [Candidatus Brocadiaceae bacterium]
MDNHKILFATGNLRKYGAVISYLNKHGFQNIITAADGEEALIHLKNTIPDFAILDINLPVLDGFQLCKILKSAAFSHCADIPIVLLYEMGNTGEFCQLDNMPVISLQQNRSACLASQLAKSSGSYGMLHVPFAMEDLLYLIYSKLNPEKISKDTVRKYLCKAKVMIADDDHDSTQLLRSHISEGGYEVVIEREGVGVISALEVEKPHILFIGCDVPGFNIADVLRWVKENLPETFIVILADSGLELRAIELMKAGAHDFLIKPFDVKSVPDIFVETLKKYHMNYSNKLLDEEELRLHAVVDGMIDGIILMDKNGKINLVNRVGNEILNYIDIKRTSDGSIISLDKINIEEVYDKLFARKQGSITFEIELKGDSEKHMVVIVSSISQFASENINVIGDRRKRNRLAKAFEGKNIGIIIVLRDVSREKNLQNQVVKSERLFAVSNLVAGAAHELNNPLAGIQLCTELVFNDSSISEKSKKYLTRVQKEIEQIQDVVKSLLTFTGNYTLTKARVNINEIINEIIKQKTYQFDHANIRIINLLSDTLPEISVDRHQIRRVLLNIIENACIVMDGIKDEKYLTFQTQEQEGMVKITIADTGPGIPKENLSKIFEPFFTKRPNKKNKGTGLGLSIAQSIINQHNGRICVNSEQGKGAAFVIELPC